MISIPHGDPDALRVRDVMTSNPITLPESLPVRTAALVLHHAAIGGAPVLDESGELVGVISEADVLEKEASRRYGWGRAVDEAWRRHDAETVGQACSRPALVTTPDSTLRDATRLLLDRQVARLVVVDGADIAGMITRRDVLAVLLRDDAELHAAVTAALAAANQPEAHATVEWGRVRLSGQVTRRSQVPGLVRRIEEIDGVMAVASDLAWLEDDVSVYPAND